MLALVAVFILLSASACATEPRKCYWCGPLAEQVHRSTRAPSCNEPSIHVTACDPGYTHCAVVATAPPYTESRLCVKLYQDECYSLYCNSTKMWRITCPCRGDLCNGPNTQREKESFAILNKLDSKSSTSTRNKRTLLSSSNFSSGEKYENNTNFIQINMTINEGNETKDDNIQSNDADNESTVTESQTTDNSADMNKTEITEAMTENMKTENHETETMPQETTQTQVEDNSVSTVSITKVTTVALQQEESSTNRSPSPTKKKPTAEALQQSGGHGENVTETTVTEASTTSKVNTMHTLQTPEPTTIKTQVEDNSVSTVSITKVTTVALQQEESSTNRPPSPTNKKPTAEALQQSGGHGEKVTETTVTEASTSKVNTMHTMQTPEPTTVKTQVEDNSVSTVSITKVTTVALQQEESSTNRSPSPTKKKPTAEALQQSGSHGEKVTETTITESSTTSKVNTMHTMRTPEPTTVKKNTAICIKNCVFTLISSIILHRCI